MKPLRNPTVNLGPLLITLSVVFTTYFAGALAVPAMPSNVQQALASLTVCNSSALAAGR
jgi:hypothetical protein